MATPPRRWRSTNAATDSNSTVAELAERGNLSLLASGRAGLRRDELLDARPANG
jgi:thiamine pyrophosphokinase